MVAGLKMLRFSLFATRMDTVRNEHIRDTTEVRLFGDKVKEARLIWFGHLQRRESPFIGRRSLKMKLQGRRQVGRPKGRFLIELMQIVGVREENAGDREQWRLTIRCGDSLKNLAKAEKGFRAMDYGPFYAFLIRIFLILFSCLSKINLKINFPSKF